MKLSNRRGVTQNTIFLLMYGFCTVTVHRDYVQDTLFRDA